MQWISSVVGKLKAFAKFVLKRNPKLRKFLNSIIELFENRFRTDDIDSMIDFFSRMKKDVYFIQIGANDGVSGDPIHTFVVRDGWSGILVEPLRDMFDRLVENYRKQKKLIFENVAISDKNGMREFWYLKKEDDEVDDVIPAWYEALGSFMPEVVLKSAKKIPNMEDYMTKEQVKCITFETLVQKHNVEKIDIVVVDTEGYDFQVIRQIDFERFKPSVILYENKHLKDDEKKECKRYLRKNGYKLIRKGGNTIAFIGKVNRVSRMSP
jgi:FkbM family methyltransferase